MQLKAFCPDSKLSIYLYLSENNAIRHCHNMKKKKLARESVTCAGMER